MLHRLILKVTKFQLPPPKRLGTVVKKILGGHHGPPMSNRVKEAENFGFCIQVFTVLQMHLCSVGPRPCTC